MHPLPKFNNMKAHFYFLMLFVGLVGFRDSNTRMISGTVYDRSDNKPIAGVSVHVQGTQTGVSTDARGNYSISVEKKDKYLLFQTLGYEGQQVAISQPDTIDVWLSPSLQTLDEVMAVGDEKQRKSVVTSAVSTLSGRVAGMPTERGRRTGNIQVYAPFHHNTESYKGFPENKFFDPTKEPLSTFAVDIDAASYSNLRRFIHNGQLPPTDAVRIEEMVNYFQYDLKGPVNGDPVAIHTELSAAPWNPQHQLLRIGLKAKSVDTDKLPSSNLVFLIDVSGSMSGGNRLPLVKASMKMLVDQLRDKDHVAIVTYAGSANIKLESTPGSQKTSIKDAIDALEAGGATAGGAGIMLAYKTARKHFITGGNNRIILASDGDFNVGPSSDGDMEQLVARERQSGVNLSVLGFGMGNLKDSKMEALANKGHGNYAYIDNINEARKAMVTEFGGTLFTVAKDVKIQVEFNPGKVQAYRLIGYENRLLEKEDFNNDEKLGGDMGVGHTVTALYEIVPAGVSSNYAGNVDPLKYQQEKQNTTVSQSTEVATVKFRYKDPHGSKSSMKQATVLDRPADLSKTSDDFRFASAVAELGMLLRESEYKQQADFDRLISRAKSAKGMDDEGYRAEFIRLAESAKLLVKSNEPAVTKE